MSVKFDIGAKIKDLQGKDTEKLAAHLLAEVLWNARQNQARAHILANRLIKGETVEFKAEDVVFIKKTMLELGLRAGEAGQLLELLGEVKEGDKA